MAQATFEEISASDFFYRNRDIAGLTNPSRAVFVAIREIVENALDAAESQKIPPDVYVRLSYEGEATKEPKFTSFGLKTMGAEFSQDLFLRLLVKCFMEANTNLNKQEAHLA